MKELTEKIAKESFSSNKVQVMKTEITTRNIGFTSDQMIAILKCFAHSKDMVDVLKMMETFILGMKCDEIKGVLAAFPFSNDRLEVLREIKKAILDPQDKFVILDMFVFGADKKTAEEILRDIRPELPPPTSVIYGRVTANDVTFVVDVSGSMGTSFRTSQGETISRLNFSIRELKNVISMLPATATFNILAFDSYVYQCFTDLVNTSEDNLRAAFKWCDNLRPGSSTNTKAALKSALEKTSAAVYLLSDGVPDEPASTIVEWLKTNNPKHIPIHTIAFLMPGRDAGAANCMKAIAEVSKGVYKAVESDH